MMSVNCLILFKLKRKRVFSVSMFPNMDLSRCLNPKWSRHDLKKALVSPLIVSFEMPQEISSALEVVFIFGSRKRSNVIIVYQIIVSCGSSCPDPDRGISDYCIQIKVIKTKKMWKVTFNRFVNWESKQKIWNLHLHPHFSSMLGLTQNRKY